MKFYSIYARPQDKEGQARLWMGKHYEGSDVQRRIERERQEPKQRPFGKRGVQ